MQKFESTQEKVIRGLTHVKDKKEKQTDILNLYVLPIKPDLIGRGKRCRSNSSKINSSHLDLNCIWLCKFGKLLVAQQCSHLGLTKKFDLLRSEKDYILNTLGDNYTIKAIAIDRLLERFLKNGANVIAKPVTDTVKLANVKPIFKKLTKIVRKNTNYLLTVIIFEGHWKDFSRTSNKIFKW